MQSEDQDDQVVADHSSTPRGSEILKIKDSRTIFKGEFVDTNPMSVTREDF
ncbi:hypothetical protein HanIR_Chr12g0567401 [Helianthus annuus]|nr:hypothetical protein HanIR_Chr12g0567401 [Helianthus annuus]